MGREIRRVDPGFDWPLGTVWAGFQLPEELRPGDCPQCDGDGRSMRARQLRDLWYGYGRFRPEDNGSTPLTDGTPAIRAAAAYNIARDPGYYGTGEQAITTEAQRLADYWNGQWCHHLNADDVTALLAANRLWDLTCTWSREKGWQPKEPPVVPTPEQVNIWAIERPFGHDSINQWVTARARCEREGYAYDCPGCGGTGHRWRDDAQHAAHDAWEPTEPPPGDGWQLWETASEGSPVSPVFGTDEELIAWMSDPDRGDDWLTPEAAANMVRAGWAPSMVASPETGVVSGMEYIGTTAQEVP